MSSKDKRQSSSRNTKFEEIQRKNLDSLNKNLKFEDSDEEIDQIDKNVFNQLFRNYVGKEDDVANLRQFFENGESIDCLICK